MPTPLQGRCWSRGLLPQFIDIQPPLVDVIFEGFQQGHHAELAAMTEAVDQGFLHPVGPEADRTGRRRVHLQVLLPQAF